jgi:hypothetical protein
MEEARPAGLSTTQPGLGRERGKIGESNRGFDEQRQALLTLF